MKEIDLDNKTVFVCGSKDFTILDSDGQIFYSPSELKNFGFKFCLPRGKYYCDIQLNKVEDENFNKPLFTLPPYERDLKHDWKEFEILFDDNPNKCTINHIKKTITFDYYYQNVPSYVVTFILWHEKGHNFYETEYKCDLYAVYNMLNEGYTPFQISKCPLEAKLKDSERLQKVFNNLNGM